MKSRFDDVVSRRQTNSFKWDFAPEGSIPMWVADMDFPCPPEIVEHLVRRARHPIYGYTSRPAETAEAVMHWLKRRHGWSVPKDQLLFCPPGVIHALSLLVQLVTAPGDGIVLQTPVYEPLRKVIEENGRIVLENPLAFADGKYKVDVEHLREVLSGKATMMILCSPHNPVGRVWTNEELTCLAKLAEEFDVFLASDEIHMDLVYPPHSHTPLGSIPEASERSATLFSANKTFNLGGLAHAMLVIPNERIRDRFQHAMLVNQTRLDNLFTGEALTAGYLFGEKWLEELLVYLQENIREAQSFLNSALPEVSFVHPEGTYLLWLDFRKTGIGHEQLASLLESEAKVLLTDGREFSHDAQCFFRMNIATPRAVLLEALSRIRTVIREEIER